MDQGVTEAFVVNRYGASDATSPSFNRQRYVKFGSIQTPRDLGDHDNLNLRLEGVVGAESGTQTLFFRFTTNKPSRIRVRRIPLNRYTDQYVSIDLRNLESDIIPLRSDGFASATSDIEPNPSALPDLQEISYVFCGYWEEGYAVFDCQTVVTPPFNVVNDLDFDTRFISPFADLLPAGAYFLVISSSQWPQLPYAIQLDILADVQLKGVSSLALQPAARLGPAKLQGESTVGLSPGAVLGTSKPLVVVGARADATLSLVPRARLTRRSPWVPGTAASLGN